MAAGLDDLDTRELLARAEVTVRLEAERRQRRVFLSRTDEHGLRTMVARIEAGDAVWIDATVDRVADHLLAHPALRRAHHPDLPEEVTKAELRAEALGWLARPHDLAACSGRWARRRPLPRLTLPLPLPPPPGQTGDHNTAPLTRPSHRATTHLGYRLEQLGPYRYRWTTPHGLCRTVDHTGTHGPPAH